MNTWSNSPAGYIVVNGEIGVEPDAKFGPKTLATSRLK